MKCCNHDCRQGRDCPARKPLTCPHCHGFGFDASGYRCTCSMDSMDSLADIGRALLLCLCVFLVTGLVVLLIK